MLMSWYMVGYHSGYYLGMQHGMASQHHQQQQQQQQQAAPPQHINNLNVKNFANTQHPNINVPTSMHQDVAISQIGPPQMPNHDMESSVFILKNDRKNASGGSNLQQPIGVNEQQSQLFPQNGAISVSNLGSLQHVQSPNQQSVSSPINSPLSQVNSVVSSLTTSATQATSTDSNPLADALSSTRVLNSGDNIKRFHTNSMSINSPQFD